MRSISNICRLVNGNNMDGNYQKMKIKVFLDMDYDK